MGPRLIESVIASSTCRVRTVSVHRIRIDRVGIAGITSWVVFFFWKFSETRGAVLLRSCKRRHRHEEEAFRSLAKLSAEIGMQQRNEKTNGGICLMAFRFGSLDQEAR